MVTAQTMIDRVLATWEAAGPPRLGMEAPAGLSFNDNIVFGLYDTGRAGRRGVMPKAKADKQRESWLRMAHQAKIPQEEIDAAIARAEEA